MSHPETDRRRLAAEQTRWRCPTDTLGFESTRELTPEDHILGQDDAVDALRFGLDNRMRGNNVFVRGLSGFGRMALIHEVIEETSRRQNTSPDRCYIHNFDSPDQPRLLALPAGRGREFRDAMDEFAEFTKEELPQYLNSDYVKSRQKQLAASTQERIQEIGRPFDEELEAAGLTMVPMQVGQSMVPVILPVIDGEPVQFDQLQQRRREGKIDEAAFKSILDKISTFEQKFADLSEEIEAAQLHHQQSLQQIIVDEASNFVQSRINAIRKRFTLPEVSSFLDEIKSDLIHHRLTDPKTAEDFVRAYRVKLVSSHDPHAPSPVVSVNTPTVANLIGKVDRELAPNGFVMRSDHLMIKPGALFEADGGYLIIEAQDILSEPGAWQALLRTLKTGRLELSYTDLFGAWGTPQLRPEPLPIDVKVVLVGDPDTYYLLDRYEPRFPTLFKILADFSDTMARDEAGYRAYANVIARIVKRDDLQHFSAAAIGQLIEHGARICAQPGRLTSQFGRIADIAREASFIAKKTGRDIVAPEDISESIVRARRRADIPARHFRRALVERRLMIDVSGETVGQVNGLAVTMAGPLVYGFPSRITASIGPGSGGAINIERESDLSGSVHTKGFLILSGLLRHMLRLKHPLAFSASIAFEQSYGGVDGDSASAAEFCCLMSALTSLPIRQDLSMTGAVDQKGNILPIGAVTEKIEGFFDACQAVEFTGSQGVVIPAANARELMLRSDVVSAIEAGEFSVYSIDRIEQALSILFDRDAGELTDDSWSDGSILALAQEKAHAFWETVKAAGH